MGKLRAHLKRRRIGYKIGQLELFNIEKLNTITLRFRATCRNATWILPKFASFSKMPILKCEGLQNLSACRRLAQFVAHLPAKPHQRVILVPSQFSPGKETTPRHKKILWVIAVQVIKPQQHIFQRLHQALLLCSCG